MMSIVAVLTVGSMSRLVLEDAGVKIDEGLGGAALTMMIAMSIAVTVTIAISMTMIISMTMTMTIAIITRISALGLASGISTLGLTSGISTLGKVGGTVPVVLGRRRLRGRSGGVSLAVARAGTALAPKDGMGDLADVPENRIEQSAHPAKDLPEEGRVGDGLSGRRSDDDKGGKDGKVGEMHIKLRVEYGCRYGQRME
jgi:hypothetical protein